MISSKIVHLIICNSTPHYFKYLEIQNFHSSGVNSEEMSYLNGIRRQMAYAGTSLPNLVLSHLAAKFARPRGCLNVI